MKLKTTEITLVPEGERLSSELGYTIRICDDSGMYLEIMDNHDSYDAICIHPEDWPFLRAAIDKMVGNCY